MAGDARATIFIPCARRDPCTTCVAGVGPIVQLRASGLMCRPHLSAPSPRRSWLVHCTSASSMFGKGKKPMRLGHDGEAASSDGSKTREVWKPFNERGMPDVTNRPRPARLRYIVP
jgi:hypothetical protein